MRVPFILFMVSLIGAAVALAVPGWSDLLLLVGPTAVAAFVLLLTAVLRLPDRGGWSVQDASAPNWIIVDGSNVMHWKDGTPQVDTLREVLALLRARGFSPGIVFDANAGYLLAGRYQHHAALGQLVGLPESRVMVVDKGTPADAIVLAAARDHGARIVTNDRYRDWADLHPEVRRPGHLIRGGYRDGALWLALDEAGAEAGLARMLPNS